MVKNFGWFSKLFSNSSQSGTVSENNLLFKADSVATFRYYWIKLLITLDRPPFVTTLRLCEA